MLGGCGFQPVYGSRAVSGAHAGVPAELAQVSVNIIADRNGQMLRNLLMDRMYQGGRPATPRYHLAVRLTPFEEDLGIRKDATATRARLRLIADIELLDAGTGAPVYRTQTRSVVSYNIVDAQYATLVAEQDAYERALIELAEDIRTRLALYLRRVDPEATVKPAAAERPS